MRNRGSQREALAAYYADQDADGQAAIATGAAAAWGCTPEKAAALLATAHAQEVERAARADLDSRQRPLFDLPAAPGNLF